MKRVLLLTSGALVRNDDFGGPNKGDLAYKPPHNPKKVKRVLLLISGALVQDDDFGGPNEGDLAYNPL